MTVLVAIAFLYAAYKVVLDYKSYQIQKFNSDMLRDSNKELIARANALVQMQNSTTDQGMNSDQIGAALAGNLIQENEDIRIRMEEAHLKAELSYHADKIVEAHSYGIGFDDAFSRAITYVKNKVATLDKPLPDDALVILGVNRVSSGKSEQEQPTLTPVQ